MSATNSGGGPSTVTVPAGDYWPTDNGGGASIVDDFAATLNASRPSGWTVELSYGTSTSTGKVTINCTQTPWSITWTSTALRDLLGFTGNISSVSSAQTGTNHMRGLWLPKCPLFLDGDPAAAPRETDLRTMQSPVGDIIGIVGNVRRVRKRLRWSHVPRAQYLEYFASPAKGSWEQFLDDTQFGEGHTWFTPASKIQVYSHTEEQVGVAATVSGWFMKGVTALDSRLSLENFTGYYSVEIPEITTSG